MSFRNLCTHESGEARRRDTEDTYETSKQPKSHVLFLLTNREILLILECCCVPAILTTAPYVKRNVCSPKTGGVSHSLQVDSEKVPPVGPRLHCSIFFTVHYPLNINHLTCRISAAGSVS
jgi:hypothetical protein